MDLSLLTEIEKQRLISNGSPESSVRYIESILSRHRAHVNTLLWIAYFGSAILGARLTNPRSGVTYLFDPLTWLDPAVRLTWFLPAYFTILAIAVTRGCLFYFGRNWAAARLAVSVVHVIRTLEAWDLDAPPGATMARQWPQLGATRRRLGRIAWSIPKSIDILTGIQGRGDRRQISINFGQTLVWVAEQPWDPKRRAVTWETLVNLVKFLGDPFKLVPVISNSAADRFTVESSVKQRLAVFVRIASGPLIVGLIIVIVSAALNRTTGT
jgi:hypothetical protein